MRCDNKINGRTPEEIKRSLKCRAMWGTPDCKMKCDECGTYVPGLNGSIMAAAALALIQQQEQQLAEKDARIAELERERDAAVEDLKKMGEFRPYCGLCAHEKVGIDEDPCGTCREGYFENNWEWRGVQEVE